jgi:predicted nucleotidyltransferase
VAHTRPEDGFRHRPLRGTIGVVNDHGIENQPAFSYAELGRALERRRRQAERHAQAVVAHVGDAGDIFARYGVTKAVLFGGHARLSPRADSDVDLLVYGLNEGRFFSLASELEERLGRTVDLHTTAERPALVGRAVRTGIIVYED